MATKLYKNGNITEDDNEFIGGFAYNSMEPCDHARVLLDQIRYGDSIKRESFLPDINANPTSNIVDRRFLYYLESGIGTKVSYGRLSNIVFCLSERKLMSKTNPSLIDAARNNEIAEKMFLIANAVKTSKLPCKEHIYIELLNASSKRHNLSRDME
jgi:hypothetical protein